MYENLLLNLDNFHKKILLRFLSYIFVYQIAQIINFPKATPKSVTQDANYIIPLSSYILNGILTNIVYLKKIRNYLIYFLSISRYNLSTLIRDV